ncbi:MAG: hypothetical protein ACTSQK_11535 [Candidatus Heimdallarchaeota archaeon]
MRRSKIILTGLILVLFIFSSVNISFTLAGYQTDPAGDADGIGACDITRIDVEVTYHSPPTDDEVLLKITLAEEITLNESLTFNWFDYNFFVDTSLTTNTNSSELTSDDYEYRAHLGRKHNNNTGVWTNTSSLFCTRYYYSDGDGSGKTMGTFYWNPNTDTWQSSDPELEVGEVVGNTIIWDVTGAIYREQPIGTGYVIQGVASASFGLVVKDRATESGWVDEFDNMCVPPSTSSTTPTNPFPSIGIIGTLTALLFVISIVGLYRKKK